MVTILNKSYSIKLQILFATKLTAAREVCWLSSYRIAQNTPNTRPQSIHCGSQPAKAIAYTHVNQ